MRNRIVGFIIIGISFLMAFIIFLFNRALTEIVNTSCSHGLTCPMWGSIRFHTNLSIGVMIFIVLIGIYLIFFGQDERIITKIKRVKEQINQKKITKANYRKILGSLEPDDRKVLSIVVDAQGSVFQSELVNKTGLTKVKVTRVLDRLEGKGLIERKRRGMMNIVILKQ